MTRTAAAALLAFVFLLPVAMLTSSLARAAVPPKSLASSLSGDAKRDYEAGKLLAADADYSGAALKFQNAYDESHDARLLWNIAFCERQLRHYARVLALLGRYQAEGGALLTERDRKEARDVAVALQPFTTTVKISVSEDEAQVFVDDELVGVSPLPSPRVVDIGTHRIRATKPGFVESALLVPVGGGIDVPVSLKLEKEVHEGTLAVHAPAGASIVLDGQVIGVSSAERAIPSGGHQLRVQASGMRPYQSEIVLADKETRVVDVVLERESEQDLPRVQVAIGCVDGQPRSAAEGLAVYLDGASLASAPIDVRMRWEPDLKRDVVAWVAYPAPVGEHDFDIRVPGCVPAHVRVDVRDQRGARIAGALPAVEETLSGGALGSPDGWRVALGPWYGAIVQQDLYGDLFGGTNVGVAARRGPTAVGAAGGALDGGWVRRWWTVLAQASIVSGATTGTTAGVDHPMTVPVFGPVSTGGTLTEYRLGVHAGPRLPLGAFALSAGVTGAVGIEEVSSNAGASVTHTGVLGGAWAAAEAKPLCDWSVSVAFEDDLASSMGARSLGGALLLGYEPSFRCRSERSTRYGVEENPL